MWSLQRTENPKELDRNQPTPHKVQMAKLEKRISLQN